MSSLRNSVHRRNHKERSQLVHRTHLGILEKHADYVKRSRDYHSKQDRINRLRQKAAERNKDEFYFAMVNERTQGGVHIKDRGNVAMPVDMVKVLKTQDENYVRTMRSAGLKKISKLKRQLTTLADLVKPGSLDRKTTDEGDNDNDLDDNELRILHDAGIVSGSNIKGQGRGKPPKHIVFVDNEQAARQYASQKTPTDASVNRDFSGDEKADMDLGWKVPDKKRAAKRRKSTAQSEAIDETELEVETTDRREQSTQHRKRLLKELSARLVRDKQMRYAMREFEMQRLLMGRGGRMKLRGVEKVEGDEDHQSDDDDMDVKMRRKKADGATYKPRVYKWRLERKR